MKSTYLKLGVACIMVLVQFNARGQYLPTAGGTMTGNLNIASGVQIQTPYLGFNNPFTQPATSGNVAIYPNSTYGTLEIVGWSNGWRFVPVSTSAYPAAVVTIDQNGNTNMAGTEYVAKNLGIGTQSPSSQLAITGFNTTNPNNTGSEIPYSAITFQNNQGANNYLIARIATIQENGDYIDAAALAFSTGAGGLSEKMRLTTAGNLLVGKSTQSNNTYKLDVNGNVRANSIVVNTSGADFVFDPAYKLNPLNEVNKYIAENHHLPGIASAEEMKKNGLDVGANETALLQKVEELTLYIIKEDKERKEQKSIFNTQRKILEKQDEELKMFKKRLLYLEKHHKIGKAN